MPSTKHHQKPLRQDSVKHRPVVKTGEQIVAEFGKDNLPPGQSAVVSRGILCHCVCGCYRRWIWHDNTQSLSEKFTELVADPDGGLAFAPRS